MKTALIVSEYNPFHKGHAHQINVLRRTESVTHIVAVMSGNFVQRGAPALFDKFQRAHLAVLGGCDLVLELPTVYAVSSAEFFALGSILSANAAQIADIISFGSEAGQLDSLAIVAQLLLQRAAFIDPIIRREMKTGKSYPVSRQIAVAAALNEYYPNLPLDVDNLFKPNNILAIEYLKALHSTNSKLLPHTLKRQGLGYNDIYSGNQLGHVGDGKGPRLGGGASQVNPLLPSATAIRALLQKNQDVSSLIPENCASYFSQLAAGYPTPRKADLKKIVLYRLKLEPDSLYRLPDARDGLGDRVINSADKLYKLADLDDFVASIKTRRYTYSRIMRLLLQFALGFDRLDYAALRTSPPPYLRVLAFNRQGIEILAKAGTTSGENSGIPLVHSLKNIKSPFAQADCQASELYAQLTDAYPNTSDFTHRTKPIETSRSIRKDHGTTT